MKKAAKNKKQAPKVPKAYNERKPEKMTTARQQERKAAAQKPVPRTTMNRRTTTAQSPTYNRRPASVPQMGTSSNMSVTLPELFEEEPKPQINSAKKKAKAPISVVDIDDKKEKLEIDPRKLIIYSEIMKPKFDDLGTF